MKKIKAYCWANGVIEFGTKIPKGAIPIAEGPEDMVRDATLVLARESYPSKPGGKDTKPLVPGVPEAKDENSKLKALFLFRHEVEKRMLHPIIKDLLAIHSQLERMPRKEIKSLYRQVEDALTAVLEDGEENFMQHEITLSQTALLEGLGTYLESWV